MHGSNVKTVCVAGKNQCAIEALKYLIYKKKDFNIVSLVNKSDKGRDGWQKSFKKFSLKKKDQDIKYRRIIQN